MKVVATEKKPIKMWLDNIDKDALQQAKNIANLPFIYKLVSIMPDAHTGYGVPIGCVFACKDVVIPNAVGVDIGCGVSVQNLGCYADSLSRTELEKIISRIKSNIPTGFEHRKEKWSNWIEEDDLKSCSPFLQSLYDESLFQLGTLGGGNHFIEIQKGSDGFLYAMVHSGSRNIGYKVAKHYNEIAKSLNKSFYSAIDASNDLAFLPTSNEHGKQYLIDMNACIKFGVMNRSIMMLSVCNAFLDKRVTHQHCFRDGIDVIHNYVTKEHHFGQNVFVHRKGAIMARSGVTCVIPGSQGTKSYIATGLGNKESFCSCSHGAGRKLGRKAARKTLSLTTEIEKLESSGVIHSLRDQNSLDEAPGAYKDINVVMKNQSALVKPMLELTPLAVIKGE